MFYEAQIADCKHKGSSDRISCEDHLDSIPCAVHWEQGTQLRDPCYWNATHEDHSTVKVVHLTYLNTYCITFLFVSVVFDCFWLHFGEEARNAE